MSLSSSRSFLCVLCVSAVLVLPANAQSQRPLTMAGRSTVYAPNGVAATSQPLATSAAIEVMEHGGNAIDAAVTAAAVLAVVEPMMTGPGGDMFALVWSAKDKKLVALNASGRAGSLMTREELVKRGRARMPTSGVETVTVPGAVAGWDALLKKYGTITLSKAVAAGDRLRRERLRRDAGDRGRLGRRHAPVAERPGRDGDVHARRPHAESGRLVPQSRHGEFASPHRQGRAGGDLRRRARTEDRRAHQGARRLRHARGSQEEPADVGDADLDDVQGLQGLGAAAEQPGDRGARDAADPRHIRLEVDGREHRAVSAPLDRSEEARLRRPRAVRRRRGPSHDSAEPDSLRSVHRRASEPHRRAQGADARRSGAGAHVERDDLSHRRRQRRQHGVVHQQPVRRVRVGDRRAGDRVRAPGSRRRVHDGAEPPEHSGAGQAPFPYAHSRIRNEARPELIARRHAATSRT